MFDDRRLENLLRAAHEVDLVEAHALRPVGRVGSRTPWRATAAWSAVAAAVAMGAVGAWWWGSRGSGPGSTTGSTEIVVTPKNDPAPEVKTKQDPPATPDLAAANADARGSIIMTIVEDERGEVKCVRWTAAALGKRRLAEVRPEELRAIGMTLACAEPAHRVLVVGLEGPRRTTVPVDDAHAAGMARCLLSAPACVGGVFNAQECATSGCVGNGVSVRVESVAWN